MLEADNARLRQVAEAAQAFHKACADLVQASCDDVLINADRQLSRRLSDLAWQDRLPRHQRKDLKS